MYSQLFSVNSYHTTFKRLGTPVSGCTLVGGALRTQVSTGINTSISILINTWITFYRFSTCCDTLMYIRLATGQVVSLVKPEVQQIFCGVNTISGEEWFVPCTFWAYSNRHNIMYVDNEFASCCVHHITTACFNAVFDRCINSSTAKCSPNGYNRWISQARFLSINVSK